MVLTCVVLVSRIQHPPYRLWLRPAGRHPGDDERPHARVPRRPAQSNAKLASAVAFPARAALPAGRRLHSAAAQVARLPSANWA